MRQPVNGYVRSFGIAMAHWKAFQQVAGQKIGGNGPWIILLRGGKECSIPWIERGFPAKPLEFKIKIDSVLGLLKVERSEYETVWAKGHHVLMNSPGGFKVHLSKEDCKPIESVVPTNLVGECNHKSWQREGLVLDRFTHLPFTSDYDVAAVIDLNDPRWGRTHLSVTVLGEKNFSSPYNQPVLDALNRLMGDGTCLRGQPRIPHGTQAQVMSGSPMNKDDDRILVFYPNGKVEQLVCATVQEGREELKNLLREFLPSTAGTTPGKVIRGPW